MILITNEEIIKLLTYERLIAALEKMFCSDYHMPLRHHHFYQAPGGHENTLILMPAWNDQYLGNKQIILAPDNKSKGIPTVSALYTLFDIETGRPLAMMNAEELTARRTACKSALAAKYLAPENTRTLLVLGGGRVAQHLIPAHLAVRDYEQIWVWLRDESKFDRFLNTLPVALREKVSFVKEVEKAAPHADVITTATMSVHPILSGAWMKEGAYLDLVGSYKPHMREVDDEAILKSEIFVDSRAGALHETGEMAIPLEKGVFKEADVRADLTELCRGVHPGRLNERQNILFKSAGLAIEDLAGAQLAYESLNK